MNTSIFDSIDASITNLERQIRSDNLKRTRNSGLRTLSDSIRTPRQPLDAEDLGGVQVAGDLRLKALRDALKSHPTRSVQQVTFQEIFTQANLRNIYGVDFETNEVRIKNENCIDEVMQFALVTLPRRHGKSYGTAWWVACFMLTMHTHGLMKPDTTGILIFSPGKRQSTMLMLMIKKAVLKLKDMGDYVFTVDQDSHEQFQIVHPDGHTCFVKALPAKEQTTRGATGDVVILEEAAVMDVQFVTNVVFPIVTMKDNALLGISTLKSQDNYYSEMLNITKEDGTKLFNSFVFTGSCEACIKAGRAAKCQHRAHERPSWVGGHKQEIFRQVYEKLGMSELLEQEQVGLSSSSVIPAFNPETVERIFSLEPIRMDFMEPKPTRTVFVGFDPHMGGKGSDLAMCCAFWDRGTFVICGLEALPADPKDPQSNLRCVEAHLKAIRDTIPILKNCAFVLIVESNARYQSQEIQRYVLDRIPDTVAMQKDGFDTSAVQIGSHSGLTTTAKVKEAMFHAFKLAIGGDSVRFLKEMVSIHGASAPGMKKDTVGLVRMLREQLKAYAVAIKRGIDPDFQNTKMAYSGKAGGKKDDLAVIVQLVLYWSKICTMDPVRYEVSPGWMSRGDTLGAPPPPKKQRPV